MALIKSVRGFTPQIGKDTFLADNATIIGDVEIGEGCRPAHLIRKIDD